jgi:hypothetical protein
MVKLKSNIQDGYKCQCDLKSKVFNYKIADHEVV